jgi:hypothetical protein
LDCRTGQHNPLTLPTAASPSSTSLTLLLGFAVVPVESAMVSNKRAALVVGCESGSSRWNYLESGRLEDMEQVLVVTEGITNSEAEAPRFLVLWLIESLSVMVVIHATT